PVEHVPKVLRDHHYLIALAHQVFFELDVKTSNGAAEGRKLLCETVADREPVDIHHPKDKGRRVTPGQSAEAIEWKEGGIAGDDDIGRESVRYSGDSTAVLYLLQLALEIGMLAKETTYPHAHDIQAPGIAGLARQVAARRFNHGGVGIQHLVAAAG